MKHRERFHAIFQFEPVDRVPLYYFGTWPETKHRWVSEGLAGTIDYDADAGPQIPGMDPDWEYPMWNCHGLVDCGLIGDIKPQVIEETDDYLITKNTVGEISKITKRGTSINQTIQYALEPTRESWERFKTYLNPNDLRRRPKNWEKRAAEIAQEDRVRAFFGGSLYGLLRNWMGIEQISMAMYDAPELLEEMTQYMCDFYIACLEPILQKIKVDLVYIFEDCCGATGPLFSPQMLEQFYSPIYQRLTDFYKQNGVSYVMLDSDGKSDAFIPLWNQCGVDILFPVEVGIWNANAHDLRATHGQNLRFMGGVDKAVIAKGKDAVYGHLISLKDEVSKGGYLPIPDHRIPPECSLAAFKEYIDVFHEVFG